MDFLGGLLGGIGSAVGASINASSAQAINSAQIQQSINMASGKYLPGLISNAQAAGINPLVAMGMHTPATPSLNVPQPGSGLGALGRGIGSALDPHENRMLQLQEADAENKVNVGRLNNINTAIQSTILQDTARRIRQDPSLIPSGWSQPAQSTALGIPQSEWLTRLLSGKWNDFNYEKLFPPGPTVPLVRRDF